MSGKWRIHSTAIIDGSAEIAEDVVIGPFCCIGENVRIGAGTVLSARVDIVRDTIIGSNCQIHSGSVIGGPPQDRKYKGEQSYVVIGDNNILREYVTIHRATGEGKSTVVGSGNMIMAYAHVGHNCTIGNEITIASYAGISGHVVIEDNANVGGICGFHQGSRIGRLAMIGGMSGVVRDIPPFMLASGPRAQVYGINVVGLRRAGVAKQVREELNAAYRLLYRSNLNETQALDAIESDIPSSPQLDYLVEFIRYRRDNGNGGRSFS